MLLCGLFSLGSNYHSAGCMWSAFLIFTVLFWRLTPSSFTFIPLPVDVGRKYQRAHVRWLQWKYSSCSYDRSERHRSDPCGPTGLDRKGDTNSGSLQKEPKQKYKIQKQQWASQRWLQSDWSTKVHLKCALWPTTTLIPSNLPAYFSSIWKEFITDFQNCLFVLFLVQDYF